ncbi:hypothetical protein FE782_03740 [Paenibacillus antri]|uniref:Uncharacterized protein n=1 Tax=Paenibacillus antri TaxID=2582848 RepID=A0A5R9GIV5_9BACL|nr:hypothetical protein [Paenibacillus antri]TLS53394.1 hypothetical protein FE782_03740 [Paenibacillus antri]
MRIYNDGITTFIDQDEEVVNLAADVNISAPYWEREVDGETQRIDISSCRPNLEVLANMYQRALSTKDKYDAAAYVKHRNRIRALIHRRDIEGSKYEFE